MKMKSLFKIFIILIVFFVVVIQVNSVYAQTINTGEYDPSSSRNPSSETKIMDKAKVAIGVIRGAGIVISVGTLIVIGIREITASAEEKSIIKKAMPGYVLGAIMVFAITVIPATIYEFVMNTFK